MSGTIAVTASETGRYTRFAICMQGLHVPPGANSVWQIGSDVPAARNQACEQAAGDWVWFIDDDHTFEPDIIYRLLDRDVDIVTPLCLRRSRPFLPVACVDDDFMNLSLYGPDELVEVQHAGSSGMLIRRHVLDVVEAPWFELGNGVSEDVAFCRKAVEAGFRIHVDMAVRLGHMVTTVVQPVWDDGWATMLEVADGAQLTIEPGER